MTPEQDTVLLLVAKAPRPGAVKTRLAAEVGAVGAARVAAAALLDSLETADAVFRHRVLALAGDLSETGELGADYTDALNEAVRGWIVLPQRDGGFGVRLAGAHADAAAAHPLPGPRRPVLQIGMDTPQVGRGLLHACARQLADPDLDAVLGLAEDGGWWVCGTTDPGQAEVLTEVPMSRADTGARTLAALQRSYRVGLVPRLADLDDLADARGIAADHPGLRTSAELRVLGVL